MGDTLRRVIEKVALVLAPTKELMRSMLPLKTGLSGSAMCEQVALSLQAILASDPYHGKWCVLQIDIKNAFNNVHRSSILEAVGTGGSSPTMDATVLAVFHPFLGAHLGEFRGRPTRRPLEPAFLLHGDP